MTNKYDHLDRQTLIGLLQRRDAERQLGLVWERDEIEADQALNDDFVALSLDAGLSHGEAPWDNLIIEGDNYDALRALRMTHKGAIRCIYIDPPYNTGNKDFVYNDRFVDKTHRFRHSLWLEFMYRRLQLAKELLADDGVIFVSIDDNEVFRLGMLMDRVFGSDRKLACLTWQTNGNFDNQAKIKIAHEYVLAYTKDPEIFPMPAVVDPNVPDTSKLFRSEIRNTIVKNGPKNPVSEIFLPAGFPASFNEGVVHKRNDERWPKIERDVCVLNGCLESGVIVRSGWANKDLCQKFIAGGFENIKDSKGQDTRFEITPTGAIENVKVRNASHVISVLRNMGSTQADSSLLADMDIRFTYPKPVNLIQYLISITSDDEATVLDFFAGSGTTAHAVAKLNAEDGGSRKFIMVSNTEATEDEQDKNLCRDVCAERVRRVLGGYTNAKGQPVEGLGGGFAYLRTRRIPKHRLALKLDHAEVWHALQLLHSRPLSHWSGGGFASDGEVAYLADFQAAHVEQLREWLRTRTSAVAAVYTWSTERLNGLLGETAADLSLLPLPRHLRERFGR
ncbi:site-specific DNA-methyltransferase [Xanthomonas campestris]|uniref:site-specific DNA-methyltransferase n=1 Tax=Xanthomonas campestris TaxID=339 RepID=UPI00096D6466|nr:site-specific DNA-methyltransferase [Xanthomonas campestris]MEA9481899.1 site-specific DNA-methyltransferase [Xanthomonas campestris]MEA9576773.1 site-specific DNA-methyltransferase [Xanthomonas campestris]MEB2113063.1 site-specific DNA-methyltransferase [Xanthomonas campestris pv. campestris]RFF71508.1 site-specific DNA-methyltransferase [Xanthomonas campestris pv. campestris]WDK31534.1 site-specific DNA-methyltransferase [Xanthomonas campestris]